ncbi:MAG: bifunctional adenosylcobinamide kinase/adenosylcobinamide-phosphate guanylyltransferase [Chloroflexi bacterium]|nr:bifunctional adenosylcobinamide kinase/adenosylcobinamide-phosphate guanylyltransferase [Chloroflexota bacterium]
MGVLFFVTGGARSGKSRFAVRLAEAEAQRGRTVVFVATMEALDDELTARVARHRAERPKGWRTVEAPLSPVPALAGAPGDACVLIDCLSLWLSNLLLAALEAEPPSDGGAPAESIGPRARGHLESRLDAEIGALLATIARHAGPTIVVSNEVGGGVVPPTALGRLFRDAMGTLNQRVAGTADRAWLLVAGRALELPPAGAP